MLRLLPILTLLAGCALAPPTPLPSPELRTGAQIAQTVSQDTQAILTKDGTRQVLHASSIKPKPKPKPQPKPKASNLIALTISKDGALLDGDAIQGADAKEKLQNLYNTDPNSHILLRASADTPYGRVVELLDIAKTLGFKNVTLVTLPK